MFLLLMSIGGVDVVAATAAAIVNGKVRCVESKSERVSNVVLVFMHVGNFITSEMWMLLWIIIIIAIEFVVRCLCHFCGKF